MIIPIGEVYRIRSDTLSWITEERVVRTATKDTDEYKKGEEYVTWIQTPCPHHKTISHAVNSLMHTRIRMSGAETILEALTEIKRITEETQRALEPCFRVSQRP